MRVRWIALLVVAGALGVWGSGAAAQDVVMNSAETINKGNIKIAVFPTVRFYDSGRENDWGVHARIGYGLADRFDVEAKFASFEGSKLYGGDAELWLFGKSDSVCGSVAVGVTWTDLEVANDLMGVGGTALLSLPVSGRLELYTGLMASRQSVRDGDRSFTRAHLVPGVEIRLSDSLDLLGELGLGLTDDSLDYGSVGLAFYIR